MACTAAWITPSFAQSYADSGAPPWSGFYLGGNLGGVFNPSDLSFKDLSGPQNMTFSEKDGGDRFFGGVHGGYGWPVGSNMYAGIEGDVGWAQRMDYLASLRGRLGWGSPRWLVYGTAGVGFMGAKEHFNVIPNTGPEETFTRSFDKTGWVGGVGAEYMVARNLSLGVEGLWYDFGSDKHGLSTSGEDFSVGSNNSFPAVRARLTWYFDN